MARAEIVHEIMVGLGRSPVVRVEMDKKAAEVVKFAQSIAPVFGDRPPKRGAPGDGEPGDYRDSIHFERIGNQRRRVISDADPMSMWVEIGSEHMPEYAVFARTAEEFGGSGPDFMGEGTTHAHRRLRAEIVALDMLRASGAGRVELEAQRARVKSARLARSAAFKADRGAPRRRRGRR